MSIVILGGGASGLAAAICASGGRERVVVCERAPRIGRKILASGNGRCNISHAHIAPQDYHGDPAFLQSVFQALAPQEVHAFLESLGLVLAQEEGRLYPYSFTAASVLDVLRLALERAGVEILAEHNAQRIVPSRKGGFSVSFAGGGSLHASQLICAMGGKAASHLGTDGAGLMLLASLGHRVSPLYPALVQLRCAHPALKSLKGVRVRAQLTLHTPAHAYAETGELLFTDYGVSGVAVFQLSRHAATALAQGQRVTLFLNLWPELTPDALAARAARFPSQPVSALFTGVFHRLLAQAVIRQAGVTDVPCGALSPAQMRALLDAVQAFALPVTGTQGFDQAQVTAGGVSTDELDPCTFSSRLYDGLYVTGEAVDIDGPCGGYNLHFALTSGMLAGRAAAERTIV